MRSSTGRWVDGDDFFGREAELALLAERLADGNHILLTGQRRMGKTSVVRELGRRLEGEGWLFFFVDIEEALAPPDVVALIAQKVHRVRSLRSRFAATMSRWVSGVDEIGAYDFRLKVRAGLSNSNWRRHGEELLEACATEPQRVLIALDELPIFLLRLLREQDGQKHVDDFLSWLRAVQQNVAGRGLSFVVSGSIGLAPLTTRLGIPDRINHLSQFRLPPWNRETCIACFHELAENYGLTVHVGVAEAVYERLGLGIPHHVQSFFEHLRDDATVNGRPELGLEAVDTVYRESLLGPWGQTDLMHYDTRLRDALDERSHRIAHEMLTEAATQGALSDAALARVEAHLDALGDETQDRTVTVLDVLTHDGYLVAADNGYEFQSRLLRDWWAARFGRNYEPLEQRGDR